MMVDFSNSAFSRLRVQFSHNQTAPKDANEVYLQYIMSLGRMARISFRRLSL